VSTAAKSTPPVKTSSVKTISKERLMNVLLAPHVTEKTSLAMQNANQYTFRVRRDATKPDIKAAVELMFEVKVADVNVVNETGKTRRFGKTPGRTQDWKKAYVKLAAGQSIDYEASRKA
jgi:large subunit ribosomal protein L23